MFGYFAAFCCSATKFSFVGSNKILFQSLSGERLIWPVETPIFIILRRNFFLQKIGKNLTATQTQINTATQINWITWRFGVDENIWLAWAQFRITRVPLRKSFSRCGEKNQISKRPLKTSNLSRIQIFIARRGRFELKIYFTPQI